MSSFLRELLSYTPGTEAFRTRRKNEIDSRTEKRVTRFTDLKMLDQPTKEHLLESVRRCAKQLVNIEMREELITIILVAPIGVIIFVVVLGAPLPVARLLDVSYSLWAWIGIYCLYLWAVMVGLTLFNAGALVFDSLRFMLAWMFTVSVACGALFYRIGFVGMPSPPTLEQYLAAAASVGLLGYAAGVGLIVLLVAPAIALLEQQPKKRFPDAVLVDELLGILSLVEREPEKWGELRFRQGLMLKLEEAAICCHRYLLPRLQSGDAATDHWLKETAEQIAAGFRSLKKWVGMPKLDTRDYFLARITSNFLCAVSGSWDGMLPPPEERMRPERLPREPLYARVVALVRILFTCLFPALALWAFQQTHLVLKGVVADYATAGVLLWAVITMLTAVNQPLSAQVTTTIKDLLPFVGKMKKE
jgi:hypothetical protein